MSEHLQQMHRMRSYLGGDGRITLVLVQCVETIEIALVHTTIPAGPRINMLLLAQLLLSRRDIEGITLVAQVRFICTRHSDCYVTVRRAEPRYGYLHTIVKMPCVSAETQHTAKYKKKQP